MTRSLDRMLCGSILAATLACFEPVAAGPRFTDATRSSGIDLTLVSGGTPSREIVEVNGGGVALFDFDRDGDLDLFFANGATMDAPAKGPGSRLYANRGDGTFEDVSKKVGLKLRRWAMGVAVGDFDGDGYDDLYVTCYGRNALLRNDVADSGKFVDVTESAGVGDDRWGTSAAFADLDADGDLDLYVVNYLEFDVERLPDRKGRQFMGVPVFVGPSGLAPQQDVLYENVGGGKFRDVTSESGCTRDRPGYGLGVVVVDIDDDGKLDLFVGNDSTENFLFRNLGELRFKEAGIVSGIATNYDGASQATMGIAVGDIDGNGLPDLFTTNFSSDTNTLHLNRGSGWFDDRTSQFGLGMVSRPFLSWGAGFYDFDSDGDEDLFVASGHVYPEAASKKMDSDYEQPPLLFERDSGRFRRSGEGAGEMFGKKYSGRSVAFGDLDGDGDVDVVMTALNGPVRIFRNDSPLRDVVVVELREASGSLRVPGARIELAGESGAQRRWIGGGSYQSVDAPRAYFAVPASKAPLRVRVRWPDGTQAGPAQAVPRNRRVTLERGKEPRSAVLPGRTSESGVRSA